MLITRNRTSRRRGVVVVWVALLIPVLVGMTAFAVDIGYICMTRNHLQVAADAGAMAGAGALSESQDAARAKAKEIAEKNYAGAIGDPVQVQTADITLGTWNKDTNAFNLNSTGPNAVRITIRKNLNLFFGRIFGMGTSEIEVTAIACKNPRDIAFVIDLSGSMNNDSEIWATNAINTAFLGYDTIGTDLMQDVFTDFGFGTYPGTSKFVGEVSGIPSNQFTPNGSANSPVYGYLTNTYLLNNFSVASKYRILGSDSTAVRKQKAYRWLIDYQLAPLMPNAKPVLNSDINLDYWTTYLDYIFRSSTTIPSQNSRKITGGSNPYPDAWPSLSASTINSFRNRVGYQTYVQFMMDYGHDVTVNGGDNVAMSSKSPDCPWHLDNDPTSPGYNLMFPPREQPTHAARIAIMAGINQVAALNSTVAVESRDHVCVITFETATGTKVRYPLSKNGCDYEAARASVRDMQAMSDWAASTASENGLIVARDHLDPAKNPDGARPFSTKILVFLSDGIPNIKKSSNTTITNFMTNNPDGEWFGSGSNPFERNAVLMQIQQIQALGWKTHSVGIGLGNDLSLMDKMARMAGTAIKNPNDPDGPKISWYASGNPANYKDKLSAIFDEITSTPAIQLVR